MTGVAPFALDDLDWARIAQLLPAIEPSDDVLEDLLPAPSSNLASILPDFGVTTEISTPPPPSEAELAAAAAIHPSLFRRRLHYLFSPEQCPELDSGLGRVLDGGTHVVGLDVEWSPLGGNSPMPAVLQLATWTDVYVLHLAHLRPGGEETSVINLPSQVQAALQDYRVIKVGVGTQ
eukprot:RCo036284